MKNEEIVVLATTKIVKLSGHHRDWQLDGTRIICAQLFYHLVIIYCNQYESLKSPMYAPQIEQSKLLFGTTVWAKFFNLKLGTLFTDSELAIHSANKHFSDVKEKGWCIHLGPRLYRKTVFI